MNPYTTAVFGTVKGENVQVGWATKEDVKGSRTVKLFPLYDEESVQIEDLSFVDDYKAKEQEQVDRSELAVEEGNKPATRAEAKDTLADKA